jgi:hypothetical protein
MSEETKKIFVQCPACRKAGHISVPKSKMKKKSSGLSTIIVKELICEHIFLAYVDNNLTVRECEELIFVPAPEIIEKSKKSQKEPLAKSDMALIRINLYPLTLSYILKCLFNHQHFGLVLEEKQEFLQPIYEKLINYLFEDTFEIDYKIFTHQGYFAEKNDIEHPIIIQRVEVLKDDDEFLTNSELGVERGFINSFYDDEYGQETLKSIKNQINNVFLLANEAKEFIKNTKRPNINKMISHLEKKFNISVNVKYAEFLVDIVKNYYKLSVKGMYKNIEMLKFKKLSK